MFTDPKDEWPSSNKTTVQVKLTLQEDERLMSRAQGKRMLNHLENFKTVTLDFSGVDSIGQAFADEVFRVFVRRHPETELVPIHMNEEIRRVVMGARSSCS